MLSQYKWWKIIDSVISIHGWRRNVWYQCNTHTLDHWRNKNPILTLYIWRYILFTSWKEPLWYVPYLYLSLTLDSVRWHFLISFKLIGKVPHHQVFIRCHWFLTLFTFYKWRPVYSIYSHLREILIVRLILYFLTFDIFNIRIILFEY